MRSTTHRTGQLTALIAVLAATVLGSAATAAAQPADPPAPPSSTAPDATPGDELDELDRALLTEAENAGDQTVTVIVAAESGRGAEVADGLRALGGTVEAETSELDYVKVALPVQNVAKAAALGAVEAIDVDGLIELDDPRPEGTRPAAPQTPPGPSTRQNNPYMPTQDTNAAQFGKAGSPSDGRGTTIAIIDSGSDLDHPALATTSSGERKIVDWFTANDPESGDGTWVAQSTATYTGSFTTAERTWTAPATGGPYTVGTFVETAQDLAEGDPQGDINRDGDTTDVFGVLQDSATRQVRVDLDQDGDFTDQTPMIDYKVGYDIGYFGTDDPATPIAERIAFVVQTNEPGFVNLGMATNAHGSHVSGIAAGSALFGGEMSGAAPGATLMSIKACLATNACTNSGLVDGVIYAGRNGADVVNISIGGLPALNDGNNATAELYNRTIAQYDMQIFISAGNSGAGINTVGDPSVATDAVSVGSSITRDTWKANYGSEVRARNNLHPFSSRGPREDGGFKPNIVAPGSAVSTTPRWQPGGPLTGLYELPPGYSMFNGTSMAAPQAAGAAALVVADYKNSHGGQRPDVAELRAALYSSATFLKDIPAAAQGNGLIDVRAAVRLLSQGAGTNMVTTSVPVSTVLSDQLATPDIGVGIFDREGVAAGASYTRTYTLTRTTGPVEAVRFNATFLGDDGTFAAPRSVSLPLSTPVRFDVQISPEDAGVHSALLQLDDPRTRAVDVRTMNTVIAAAQLQPVGGYAATLQGTVGRNQTTSMFANVPVGSTALVVNLVGGGTTPGAGQVRFLRFDPTGVPLDDTATTNCYNPDAGAGCLAGTPDSRTVVNPAPGVWEIVVEARRTSDVAEAPFTVTASTLQAVISPDPDVIESATPGVPVPREYTVQNLQGAFTGRLTGGPLRSVLEQRPTIADAVQQQYQITVPAGSTALSVDIGSTSDIQADLDLVLLDCTTGSCVQAAISADADSEEAVTVPDPAAGLWVAVVDGFDVPAGTTEFDYTDTITNPAYGSLVVDDTDALRETGATWTVPATLTAGNAPGAGRTLQGVTSVVTDTGAQVAIGTVLVRSLG